MVPEIITKIFSVRGGMRALQLCAIYCFTFLGMAGAASAAGYKPPTVELPTQPLSVGTDPLLETSWHLDRINARSAWQMTKGSPSVVIAIIDSGLKYNNPEIAGRIKRKSVEIIDGIDNDGNGFIDDAIGWNFNEDVALPFDDDGHGTFVASIIAAEEGDGLGGVGVCPKCQILPLRFMDKDGLGDTSDAVKAIRYAVAEKVSVINLSFCGEGYDRDLSFALQEAMKADIVVVGAAGNDGLNIDRSDLYPQKFRFDNFITVAASKKDDELSERSNHGTKYVNIAAPGVNIWGLWSDDKWYRSGGTSFAAPQVAAVAGLIRSANPSLHATEVVRIILATVDKVEGLAKDVSSGGVLDAAAAVKCAVDPAHACLN
jgi:subtilisin family serine protease